MIAAIDARATKLGQDRTKYILSLVERDLSGEKSSPKHRFASEDIVGSMRTGIQSGDNATVRRIVRRRLHEKNR